VQLGLLKYFGNGSDESAVSLFFPDI